MTHSHPLGLHIFHYQDVTNIFEIKRRARNEYRMYEKNEMRINMDEFRAGENNIANVLGGGGSVPNEKVFVM